MDSPGTVNSWTTGKSPAAATTAQPVSSSRDDPFANWTPSEVTQKLVKSNVRWGFMAGILMIALGLIGLGYWSYQQPSLAVEAAHNDLLASAQMLQPSIEAVPGDGHVSEWVGRVQPADPHQRRRAISIQRRGHASQDTQQRAIDRPPI